MRVMRAFRAQIVENDLLHRLHDIEIEKAVHQAHMQRTRGIGRNEPEWTWIMLLKIFNDDRSIRQGAGAGHTHKNRHRPEERRVGEDGVRPVRSRWSS